MHQTQTSASDGPPGRPVSPAQVMPSVASTEQAANLENPLPQKQIRSWSARRPQRTILRLLGVAALILLLFLCYKGIRLSISAYAGYQNAQALLALRQQSHLGSSRMLVAAYPHVVALQHVAADVEAEMAIFAPLLHGMRNIPRIGETVGAIPSLLNAGRELAAVGAEGVGLLAQIGQARPEAGINELLVYMLAEHGEALPSLVPGVVAAQTSLAQIQTDRLIEQLAEPVSHLLATTRLLEAGLHLGPELAGLIGLNEPRTYLLLIQNNHELRATGGFISAVGEITLENGRPGEIQLMDSYKIADQDVDHPAAPQPLQIYMGIELIFLRDANWSPDFPTTASLVSTLYTQNTGRTVDGIIALDLYAVQRGIDALGALEIEGADAPITGENFVEQVIAFWDSPLETGDTQESVGLGVWWGQRKDFMPMLAGAAIERVRSGQINPLALAGSVFASLDAGSIQVWLADPVAAQALAHFGWDGRIAATPEADYLAVVDTNVGYNKVDAVLTRALEYTVEWPQVDTGPPDTTISDPDAATAIATVTLHYRHTISMPGYLCDLTPRYGENYADMTERCYYNFVRIFVPQGSTLIAAEGIESDSLYAQRGPNNTDILGGYFVMKPGESHTARFIYALPASITPESYRLTLRKQAGSNLLPMRLSMRLPEGAHTLTTTLDQTYFTWTPLPPAQPVTGSGTALE